MELPYEFLSDRKKEVDRVIRVYFDTFVYNRLSDEKKLKKEIFKLKHNKKIEVFFSDYLFNELACIFLKEPLRGHKIFEIVLKLISGKILKQRESLINEEICAFSKNAERPDVIYGVEKTSEITSVIRRMVNEDPVNNIPLSELITSKIKKHSVMKEIVNHYKGNINFEQFSDFKDYYNNSDVKNAENEFIHKLLSEKIVPIVNHEVFQKIKDNRVNLPHLDAYLRMVAAYRFALFKRKSEDKSGVVKKTNRGDDYDMRHFISAATLDILVCDHDFLQIMKWTYPHKHCVLLDNFLTLF